MQSSNKRFVILHFKYALKLMSECMLIVSKAIFQKDNLTLIVKKNVKIIFYINMYLFFLYQTLMVNGNLVPTLFLRRPQWRKICFEVAFEIFMFIPWLKD